MCRLVGMALPPDSKYRQIEQALGEPLLPLLDERRNRGVAWRRIAVEITVRTGIDIAGETLRVWHQGIAPVNAA
jgi:hypothetical protein